MTVLLVVFCLGFIAGMWASQVAIPYLVDHGLFPFVPKPRGR